MEASTFAALALACAPQVHLSTAQALVSVESSFNPWAIGVVGGTLRRQPNNRAEWPRPTGARGVARRARRRHAGTQ
jgi:type IV secretion system protein VirB1